MTTRRSDAEIIAHRGFSARAPENTLAAMEAAIVAGADAVEWDVQIAACGAPVLFHDSNLGRTTNGAGPLARRTLGDLAKLDAGAWFSPEFSGERIPTLEAALAFVQGRVSRVYCEVKAYRELEDIDRIVSLTQEAALQELTVFISIDWRALDHIALLEPSARLGYIVDKVERFEPGLDKASARAGTILDFDHRLLLADPGMAARTRALGIDMAVWTVNDPKEASVLRAAGVRGFTTNEVEALLAWRDGADEAVS